MKKNKLGIGKRGQSIGTTLDMILAFFIILFILTIFIIISFLIAEKKTWLGGSNTNLYSYDDNQRSQIILFSLVNSPIFFNGSENKIQDILKEHELYNMDENTRSELRELIKNQTLKLIGNSSNKCFLFQAIYGINDTTKLTNVDPRGGQYTSDYLKKNTVEFNSAPDNLDPRAGVYVQNQINKMLASSANIILVRNITTNLFGVDTGEKQKIFIKFYNGECLG